MATVRDTGAPAATDARAPGSRLRSREPEVERKQPREEQHRARDLGLRLERHEDERTAEDRQAPRSEIRVPAPGDPRA
jgi:hypothetical protein